MDDIYMVTKRGRYVDGTEWISLLNLDRPLAYRPLYKMYLTETSAATDLFVEPRNLRLNSKILVRLIHQVPPQSCSCKYVP
jgi:hypothetical protein